MWGEMIWGEMIWGEMIWGEMIWGEINEHRQTQIIVILQNIGVLTYINNQ